MDRHLARLAFAAAALVAADAASAQGHQGHAAPYAKLSQGNCTEATLQCARSATPAFAPDGTLWVVWNAGGAVSIARSTDLGKTFDTPRILARHDVRLDVGPDARPSLAITSRGDLAVAYAFFKDDAGNAEIDTVGSRDGGRTFSAPKALSAAAKSQRFPALVVGRDDRVFASWIDKRAEGPGHGASGVSYAWSDDAGAAFAAPGNLADTSCECCRIGATLGTTGQPVVAYRTIFGKNIRDHATQSFAANGSPTAAQRVSDDQWATDSCPHHGPSVAVSAAGATHVAWFTQGATRSGLFYAHTQADGTYQTPRALGTPGVLGGRPAVLAMDRTVWLAWKEFDGKRTRVFTQRSNDDGATWTSAIETADAAGYNDHPLLVRSRDTAYLSWVTQESGYRLIALGGRS